MGIIKDMLKRYIIETDDDRFNALREIMQEIALAGLNRAGFFDKAAFYGGTCLRIFYDLPRFSEDLDFSLLQPDPEFSLQPYFTALKNEFESFGFNIEITQKEKSGESEIVSAFLKKSSSIYNLTIEGQKKIKIKFEVDINPPLAFQTEEKLLLQPYSFYVTCFSLPDLFAGKMHALLYRNWKRRVKGRDWFDFEWYVKNKFPLNLDHFNQRALQNGGISSPLGKDEFNEILIKHISSVDLINAKNDIKRFLKQPEQLEVWSADYFLELSKRINYFKN